MDGVNYFFTCKFGIYFVATARHNVSPSMVFDVLYRMMKVFRDYCGVLSEEAIRKNFVLIYEVIDEVIDNGHAQLVTTEAIRPFIVNEPVLVTDNKKSKTPQPKKSTWKPSFFKSSTVSSTAITKPIQKLDHKKSKKNEIFVDIFEKLTVLFNANGVVLNSSIDGVIQMKSYLQGNPELRLVLNNDLSVGKGGGAGVCLDDTNFHECVDLRDFEAMKTLTIQPPDGEFLVMNYRVNSEFTAPFRLYPFLDELNQYKLQFVLKIRSNFPAQHIATGVVLKFPVPRSTQGVSYELPKAVTGQSVEYKAQEQVVVWTIQKFPGGGEHQLCAKIGLRNPNAAECRKEVGPVSCSFEIPMYNVSRLKVQYLKIANPQGKKNFNPHRWVRYVTQNSSYVCRT